MSCLHAGAYLKGGKIMDDNETKEIERINQMTQEEMARLWRFAPPGHIYFDKTKPFWSVFDKRFKILGSFTPAISKRIDF
jgi:hypothetical protein